MTKCLYRSEAFADYCPLTVFSSEREFLSLFAKTTLWEGKVSQSVSTIFSETVVIVTPFPSVGFLRVKLPAPTQYPNDLRFYL